MTLENRILERTSNFPHGFYVHHRALMFKKEHIGIFYFCDDVLVLIHQPHVTVLPDGNYIRAAMPFSMSMALTSRANWQSVSAAGCPLPNFVKKFLHDETITTFFLLAALGREREPEIPRHYRYAILVLDKTILSTVQVTSRKGRMLVTDEDYVLFDTKEDAVKLEMAFGLVAHPIEWDSI